ncbi:hypothetical protein NEUTE1DRAFT_124720 [Neurospora tetrasperma FGSC 2508]|uniref:Glycosyl transferase CAP10 domain-containing protein n=1 Tax=Neurospora tetrasperma (strain FGSC 2508 / ATCC MYA-4615 / P0657) TaxID=510951 RepID=F8MXL0_NEUT8|nr:uncharacterized protein NEUTE1DRAFT_124720 [Neurospora tetrasperma FGSC 2508]EGO54481.1 hypothetical protein NEUTE1DRAFT_124720 [Neurospora tetrasperma FGSC 2508]
MRNINITNLKYRQRRRLFKLASVVFFSCLTLWSLGHYFFRHGSSSVVVSFPSLFSSLLFSSSVSSSSTEGGNFDALNGEEGEVDYEVIALSRARSPSPREGSMRTLTDEISNNLSLDAETCRTTFPGLMKEIDDTVAKGPFKVKRSSDLGPMQVRIRDGKMYVLHAQRKRDLSREMVNSRTAALHQVHRALLTLPPSDRSLISDLDTILTINILDTPFGTALQYTRNADPAHAPSDPDARTFLIPHFSFWAWDLPFIGSISRAASAITNLEITQFQGNRWHSHKDPRAVWRGTTWFNSIHNPQLRYKLVSTTKGKPWADVQSLEWATATTTTMGNGESKNATNSLAIEDFCKYKYVIHTEGISYSGRFQFLQMCTSVTLTPPIQWMQHTTHLVKPLFSSDLDLDKARSLRMRKNGKTKDTRAKPGKTAKDGIWTPHVRHERAWPKRYDPNEANIVFVSPDWSDLEDTIHWLEEHPKVAEGIARRQRELFVGGGYFSPAAEACYWRELVRGWAKMARPEQGEFEELGVPYEDCSAVVACSQLEHHYTHGFPHCSMPPRRENNPLSCKHDPFKLPKRQLTALAHGPECLTKGVPFQNSPVIVPQLQSRHARSPVLPYPPHILGELFACDFLSACPRKRRMLVWIKKGVLQQLDVCRLHRLEDLFPVLAYVSVLLSPFLAPYPTPSGSPPLSPYLLAPTPHPGTADGRTHNFHLPLPQPNTTSRSRRPSLRQPSLWSASSMPTSASSPTSTINPPAPHVHDRNKFGTRIRLEPVRGQAVVHRMQQTKVTRQAHSCGGVATGAQVKDVQGRGEQEVELEGVHQGRSVVLPSFDVWVCRSGSDVVTV